MVMKKIHCCKEPDCYKICREMCEDLISGMSEDDVAKKEHEFIIEAFIMLIVNMFQKMIRTGKL